MKVAFSILCFSIMYWKYNKPEECSSPTAVLFLSIGLGTQDIFFTFAYFTMWKYTQKHFKDDLAGEKNKMVLTYGIILLSCLMQTLFFLAEIHTLFC
jgi:hypothetical protein